jgi:hypothetical protein
MASIVELERESPHSTVGKYVASSPPAVSAVQRVTETREGHGRRTIQKIRRASLEASMSASLSMSGRLGEQAVDLVDEYAAKHRAAEKDWNRLFQTIKGKYAREWAVISMPTPPESPDPEPLESAVAAAMLSSNDSLVSALESDHAAPPPPQEQPCSCMAWCAVM